jgi:NADH:ubiquinone oxidoreductase subunit 6 (subunit J)
MKARNLSLIGKGIALAMILATWFYRTFVLKEDGGAAILVYTGAVVGLFIDVAVNLALDKKKRTADPGAAPIAPDGA